MKQVAKRDINKIAGARMRMFRLKQGMEQGELAKKLGMSPGAYSKIEAGLTDVNYSRLLQIAGELKVPIIDLLSDHPAEETWNAKWVSGLRNQITGNIQRLQMLNEHLLELLDQLDSNNNY